MEPGVLPLTVAVFNILTHFLDTWACLLHGPTGRFDSLFIYLNTVLHLNLV